MSWHEAPLPVRMQRVAVVAPQATLRETLVRIADTGCVELDRVEDVGAGPVAQRLRRLPAGPASPLLSVAPPDLDVLEHERRADLLAGEAQLETHLGSAVRSGQVAALAGWCPVAELPGLEARLAGTGGAVVRLRAPHGVDPPTLLREGRGLRRSFAPLVTTYGTVPYADVDPTWPAGVAYVVMFGLMFGDAGHGALLLFAALLLRAGRPRRLARLRRLWPFIAGAGLASILAGVAYGEFFGPTGVLPVLWLNPLDQPERLLTAAIGVGALLLALAYVAGTVNRWREGGPRRALYAGSGVAGLAVFLGLALGVAGVQLRVAPLAVAGGAVAVVGLALAATGFYAASAGGLGGAVQTGVQLFDTLVRIGANTVSFARLAAFGLTHAALSWVVWRGTAGLVHRGPGGVVGAVLLFAVGTVVAFLLEALVAGVQALRLEFYELFSRVFESQGRPFRPWHVPIRPAEVT